MLTGAVKGKILHGSVRNKYRARAAAQDIGYVCLGCKPCIYNARYLVSFGWKPCMYNAEKASEHGKQTDEASGKCCQGPYRRKIHVDGKSLIEAS